MNPTEEVYSFPAIASQVEKVVTREVTEWRRSDDSKNTVQDDSQPCVIACMVEIEQRDAFGGILYSAPGVMHRFFDQAASKNRLDPDFAVSELRADLMHDQKMDGQVTHRGLKTRFGSHIAEYEKMLVEQGRELPIVLFSDEVYPMLITVLKVHGVMTINAFAVLDADGLEKVREQLVKDKLILI